MIFALMANIILLLVVTSGCAVTPETTAASEDSATPGSAVVHSADQGTEASSSPLTLHTPQTPYMASYSTRETTEFITLLLGASGTQTTIVTSVVSSTDSIKVTFASNDKLPTNESYPQSTYISSGEESHGVPPGTEVEYPQTTSSWVNNKETDTTNDQDNADNEAKVEDLNPDDIMNELCNSKATDIELLTNITAPCCYDSLCVRAGLPTVNCFCDESCYFYKDCCYSMIEKIVNNNNETRNISELITSKVEEIENQTLMFRKDLISCVGDDDNNTAFFMVSACNSNINYPGSYIEKCSSNMSYNFKNVPVDHVINNQVFATFANIYCALCNDIPLGELVFWKINIICGYIDTADITDMLLDDIAKIDDCTLQPFSENTYLLRRCYKEANAMKTCPDDVSFNNHEVINLCESYIYPVTDLNDTEVQPYRNPHCATCRHNRFSHNDLECVSINSYNKENQPGNIVKPVDLQVFFDFSHENGITSNLKCVQQRKCETYEVYDCVAKRCSQLYCAVGQTPRDGSCVDEFEMKNFVTDTTLPRYNSSVTHDGNILVLELASTTLSERIINELGITIEEVLYKIVDVLSETVSISDRMENCICLMINNSRDLDNNIIAEELFHTMLTSFGENEKKEKHNYTPVLTFISVRNFHDLTWIECSGDKLIVETNASVTENDTFYLPSMGITVYEKNCNWQISFNTSYGIYYDLVATCLVDGPPNMNCSMVAYELYEVVLNNDSVSILDTNAIIYKNDFAVYKNQVFICSSAVTDFEDVVNVFAYSSTHRILSIVTSSVSVVSVVIIILVHGYLKRLRNIHGLNLTALSVSLLFLHILLIVQPMVIVGVTCIIYAIALHFLLLNNFVWMNIIGYDMTRIFRRDIVVSQSSPIKRFIGYAMISVTLPTLVIALCSSLEFTGSSFKPSYGGNDVCWLSNRKGIIAFVIAPVVFSLLLNICFFTFTVVAIQMKTKQTKFARRSGNTAYFIVYLKLTIILGFTWNVGIIGAFVQQEWLWILHLMLNGLQGVSLLMCSIVNARNVRQLRTSMKLYTGTASSNGTLSTSDTVVNTRN